MEKKPKILLTYIEAGMGHIMSMRSVEDSLAQKYGGEVELMPAYVITDDNDRAAKRYNDFTIKQVQNTNRFRGLGHFVFFCLDVLGKPTFRFLHKTLFRKATRGVVASFEKRRPDVIVSTHYFMTYCAVEYRRKIDPDVIVVTYNPDNNVHIWWDNRDGIFINNNLSAQKQCERQLFKKKNLRLVDFSVRAAAVACNATKAELRRKWGLPPDKFTVIMADGAYAMGRLVQYAKYLMRTRKPLTIIVIAGKNEKVFKHFDFLKDKVGDNITLVPLRFIPEIYELYGASDLFISKSGPNAILECVTMGTPVLLNFCPQPMERSAYRLFVKKLGCGTGIFKPKKARRFVENCVDNPDALDAFRRNVAQFQGRGNGSFRIADIIMEELALRRARAARPAE